MNAMRRRIAAMVAVASSVMLPSGAWAAHMCWVDHATRAFDGVEVYFLKIGRIQCNDCSLIEGKDNALAHVHIKNRQKANISQSRNNSCTLSVKMEKGVLGVLAESHMNFPGWVPNITNEFIPVTAH